MTCLVRFGHTDYERQAHIAVGVYSRHYSKLHLYGRYTGIQEGKEKGMICDDSSCQVVADKPLN